MLFLVLNDHFYSMSYFQRRGAWRRLVAAEHAAHACATVGGGAQLHNLQHTRGIDPHRALLCLRRRTRQLAGRTRRAVVAMLAQRTLAVHLAPESVACTLALAQLIYTLFGEGTRDCRAAMAIALTYRRHALATSFDAVAARCAQQNFMFGTRSPESGFAPAQSAGPR